MDESPDLRQLRVACLRLLAAYVFEADRTLSLLASYKKFPITLQKRLALIEQEQKENDAYQDYHSARAKMMDGVLADSTRRMVMKAS